MPNHKEYLRNTVGFLPKVELDDELLKEKKQLINIGSRAADGALGLGLFRLGDSIEEVKDLLSEGYEFLEKDLEEDLEIIEKGSDYPILKRIEKHYDPEKIIREVFPKQIKADEKITDKKINKIRLNIEGWKKTLRNLSTGQLISDRQIENLQETLGHMSEPYIIKANECSKKYAQKSYPDINID